MENRPASNYPWLARKWVCHIGRGGEAVSFEFHSGRHAAWMCAHVVMTCGNFDPLHPGHCDLLWQAKHMGTCLIVGVDDDEAVRRQKGTGRPYLGQEERLALVAGLEWVDAVYLQHGGSSEPWLCNVHPGIFVKGGDRTVNEIPETPWCHRLGIELRVVERELPFSSRAIVGRVTR